MKEVEKIAVMKYVLIKSKEQYNDYCNALEELVFSPTKTEDVEDEIELLTFLIETYDKENNTFEEQDPIELLKGLMDNNDLKAKDLVEILGISKGLVSDILNYKKGLSKVVIRKLSDHFGVNQAAFNRPYTLKETSTT